MTSLFDINYAIKHGNFDNEELNSIVMALQYRRAQLAAQNKRALSVGSAVRWRSSRDGRVLQGTVQKIAIKYVTVRTTQGNWKVPASMLEKV